MSRQSDNLDTFTRKSGENPPQDARLGWQNVCYVLLFGVSILSISLDSARVLTYHETLFAQPAKEMVQTGDWVIPRIAGKPSCHKPPLTYWTIAASMMVFRSDAEWVVRLPMVIAALAAALLVARSAAAIYTSQTGLLAGLTFLSSFYVLMQARLAEADILLCLTVCAAYACYLDGITDHDSGRRRVGLGVLFFLVTALSFLIKGPLGPGLILGGITCFVLWDRRWTDVRFLFNPAGWLLAVAVAAAWPIAAYLSYPQIVDDWYAHNVGRFAGTLGGRKPPLFYFYIVPAMLLPWTPFVFGGLWKTHHDREWRRRHIRLWVCWFAFGFTVFSLSAWKHKHYVIPLLPPFSIFAALGIEWLLKRRRFFAVNLWLGSGLLLIAAAAGVGICGWLTPGLLAPAAIVIGAIAVALGAALMYERKQRPHRQLAALFASVWITAVVVHGVFMPHFDSYADQTRLAERINETVPDGATLHVVGLPENQIFYYLDRNVARCDDPEEWQPRAADYVLGPKKLIDRFAPGAMQPVDQTATIRRIMSKEDQLTLFRVTATLSQTMDAKRY